MLMPYGSLRNSESDWTCYSRSWITRACHGTTTTRERAIRQGVLHRKISGGRLTWTGAEVFEVILSTYKTAKKRGDRFIEMVRAKFNPPAGVVGCGVGAS